MAWAGGVSEAAMIDRKYEVANEWIYWREERHYRYLLYGSFVDVAVVVAVLLLLLCDVVCAMTRPVANKCTPGAAGVDGDGVGCVRLFVRWRVPLACDVGGGISDGISASFSRACLHRGEASSSLTRSRTQAFLAHHHPFQFDVLVCL